MLKGNKGEWSELYVFAKLLAEGKLFQSDINLNKNENSYYEITKAYREESNSSIEYERGNEVQVYKVMNGKKTLSGSLDLNYLNQKSELIYKGIKKNKGKSFNIEEANDFIENAQIKKLTALTSGKTDIKLRIYDHRLATEADLGFSVKSLIGEDSTLFNTGLGNNFIYEVENDLNISLEEFNRITYKPPGRVSKLTARLKMITEELGLKIKFKGIQSPQLFKNLKMIDGDLPEIIAHSLLYRWLERDSSLMKISELLEKRDPLNFYNGEESEQKLYEYKLKRFLAECAMGMTSETVWQGVYDATGGVIIAKEDGDIVCFHIYDFNLLREYLINNTKFEQPSTGEDGNNPGVPRTTKETKKYYYGWLYQEDGKLFIKINLQIRFI